MALPVFIVVVVVGVYSIAVNECHVIQIHIRKGSQCQTGIQRLANTYALA